MGYQRPRVRILCQQGKIEGVTQEGRAYLIPETARKPADGRVARHLDIPEQYAALFARIDAKCQDLNRHRPLTTAELQRLREEFTIEYTYNSNAIEGSTLTLKETALVLEGITIDQKPLKEHLEAVGHRDAFLYVQELVSAKAQLSERIIKDIHALVLMDRREEKGVYRRLPVRIVGAKHEPPQPYLVPVQMETLVSSYASEMARLHPIHRAALFHLRFEGIHPFIDGNGRCGRLVMNLDLMRQGYSPIDVKFADRKRYYECFDAYCAADDPEAMIQLLAGYAESELDRYLTIL